MVESQGHQAYHVKAGFRQAGQELSIRQGSTVVEYWYEGDVEAECGAFSISSRRLLKTLI